MERNTTHGLQTPERFDRSKERLTTDCPVCGTPIDGLDADARTTVEPCGHAATQLTTHMMTSTTDSDANRLMTDGGIEMTSYRVTCSDCEMSEDYSQEDIAIGRKLAHADVRGHRVDVQQVATDGGMVDENGHPMPDPIAADEVDGGECAYEDCESDADYVVELETGATFRLCQTCSVENYIYCRENELVEQDVEADYEVVTDGGAVPAADSDLYDPEDGFHTCPDCGGDCQYQSPEVVLCCDCETEFAHYYDHDGTNNLFRAPDNEHAVAVYDPADDRRGEVMPDGGRTICGAAWCDSTTPETYDYCDEHKLLRDRSEDYAGRNKDYHGSDGSASDMPSEKFVTDGGQTWRDFDIHVMQGGTTANDYFHSTDQCPRIKDAERAVDRDEHYVRYHEPLPCVDCHPEVGNSERGQLFADGGESA